MKRFTLIAAIAAALASAGAHAQEIYSTFNEDPANLFDCCNTAQFFGDQVDGAVSEIAIPLMSSVNTHVTEVDMPISVFEYTHGHMRLTLNRSTPEGLPGKVKHDWPRVKGGQPNQCCGYDALWTPRWKYDHLKLTGGEQYWLVIRAFGLGSNGWNLNNQAITGPYAIYTNGAWSMTEGPLPAVRVLTRAK